VIFVVKYQNVADILKKSILLVFFPVSENNIKPACQRIAQARQAGRIKLIFQTLSNIPQRLCQVTQHPAPNIQHPATV
jgi:hypothetical protein